MPSVRLTNSDRSFMIRMLLKPLESKIDKVTGQMADMVTRFCRENMPEKLLEAFDTFPGVFKEEGDFHFSDFFKQDWPDLYQKLTIRRSYVNLKRCPLYFDYTEQNTRFSVAFKSSRFWQAFMDAALELGKMESDRNQLKNMLTCKLDEIMTLRKLKDELPEAYTVLMQKDAIELMDGCTSTEFIRAKLAAVSK